jgi:hypothetical protein
MKRRAAFITIMIVMFFVNCNKQTLYQFKVKNKTPFLILNMNLSMGGLPNALLLDTNSERELGIYCEGAGPVDLKIGVTDYRFKDTNRLYKIFNSIELKALSKSAVNTILVAIDSAQLPSGSFIKYTLE